MSKANPKKAMAALLPSGGSEIRPMTLGVYAALERIGSPLVTNVPAKDTLELIPSLYLLTHDPREIFRGNILDLAMQWADTQPVDVVEKIKAAALEQMAGFIAVLPEQEVNAEPKKKTTDGSRSTLTGRQNATDGASRKSCGESRSVRSASCGVRKS